MNHEFETRNCNFGGDTIWVKDVVLNPRSGSTGELTRRVLRARYEGVHPEYPEYGKGQLSVTLIHQRRHKKNEPWRDVNGFTMSSILAGEEVRFILDTQETQQIIEQLVCLQQLPDETDIKPHKKYKFVEADDSIVITGEKHKILQALLEEDAEGTWQALSQVQQNLLHAVSLRKQYEMRCKAISLFKKNMDKPEATEPRWQEFFEKNEWIFGHGLDYRYLDQIEAQANYGGVEVNRRGGVVGDFLMATKANVGFTVLVEIKTPLTALLGKKIYRNKAWELGSELTGAVAQIQAQCAQWAESGSRTSENAENFQDKRIYTHEPKGILVIGNLEQVADDTTKRSTFERFRRNLHNPEIITFDELLARAEFMVKKTEASENIDTMPATDGGSDPSST